MKKPTPIRSRAAAPKRRPNAVEKFARAIAGPMATVSATKDPNYLASLPEILQRAHVRSGMYIASVEDSGVVRFHAARSLTYGWVQLLNVENTKNLPLAIELPLTRIIYVAEEGEGEAV